MRLGKKAIVKLTSKEYAQKNIYDWVFTILKLLLDQKIDVNKSLKKLVCSVHMGHCSCAATNVKKIDGLEITVVKKIDDLEITVR
jgi:hypothetical protein